MIMRYFNYSACYAVDTLKHSSGKEGNVNTYLDQFTVTRFRVPGSDGQHEVMIQHRKDECSLPSFPEKRDVSEMDLLSSNGILLNCFQCTDCEKFATFDRCEATCPNDNFICYKDVFYNENNETVTNRGCTLPIDCASCAQQKGCTRFCCNADECNGGDFLQTSAAGIALIVITALIESSL